MDVLRARERGRPRSGRAAGAILRRAAPFVVLLALAGLILLSRGTRRPDAALEPGRPAPLAEDAERPGGALAQPAREALGTKEAAAPVGEATRMDLDAEHQEALSAPVPKGPAEKELYERWLQRLREDPTILEREAERLLAGSGPRNELVALLRAGWDARAPAAPRLFAQVVLCLPDEPSGGELSLPELALRLLAARAAREPLAWSTLHEGLRRGPHAMAPRLRRVAIARLAESAPLAELDALADLARADEDHALLESLDGALRARGDEPALAALRRLGREARAVEPAREEES